MSAYEAEDIYIAIVATGTNEFYLYVDDVVSDAIPTCFAPTDLVVDATTTETIDISWTANTSETSWEVVYGDPGFDPETEGTTLTATGSPSISITNLDHSSTYEVAVKANCGAADGDSIFSETLIVNTACDVVDIIFENFDSTPEGEVPNCFSVLELNPSSSSNLEVLEIVDATSSPNVFKFYNGNSTDVEQYLISGELSNLVDADHRLRFMFDGTDSGNVTLEVGTMTDPTDATTFTSIETIPNEMAFEEFVVNFDEISTDTYVAFKVTYSGTYYSVYLDDVYWEEMPSCPKPQDLIFNVADQSTADLSWTAGGSETEWEVVYGAPGFDPETEGTTETATTSPNITLTGLTANTEYEAYVRAVCGAENSQFSTAITFYTTCTSTTVPFLQDFEGVSAPQLPNCGTLENNGDGNNWQTTADTNGFGFTSQVLSYGYDGLNPADTWYFTQGIELETGVNYQMSYTYGTNGGSYTENLRVSFGATATASAMNTELAIHNYDGDATSNTVYFTVDTDGVYYFGMNAYSDANQNYLYVDDIEIVEAAAVPCASVTAITFNNVTANTVDVSWASNGSETEWEILYGETGFDPETEGTSINDTDDLGETLENLTQDTTYDVYVRAICSATEESTWAGPESFTTTVSCAAPSNLMGETTGFDTATLSWNENGTSSVWLIIYGEVGFDPETEGTTVEKDDNVPQLNLTGLEMDTTYEFYIKALCSETNESAWAGPESFSTYYCATEVNSAVEPITRVEVAGIDNTSDATIDANEA